jgi:hypothetical protein
MDLMILKKRIDGYRDARGCLRNVPPELLLDLRQSWEHYPGSPEQFRSELGVRTGTLRKLLIESKKLNHVIASVGAVGLGVQNGEAVGAPGSPHSEGNGVSGAPLELAFDNGSKVIRFPTVDLLIEFMRKSA